MKTWLWFLAGGLAVGLLAGLLWLGHGWLTPPSDLQRQLRALREQVYYAPSQTYGQLAPDLQRHLQSESDRLWDTLDQRRAQMPLEVSTRIVIANASVLDWLRWPGSEPRRQQAVRDLDRAIAVTP